MTRYCVTVSSNALLVEITLDVEADKLANEWSV